MFMHYLTIKARYKKHLFSSFCLLCLIWNSLAQQRDFQAQVANIDALVEAQDYANGALQIEDLRESFAGTSYMEEDSVNLYIFNKLSLIYYQLDSCDLAIANNRAEVDLRFEIFGPADLATLQTMRNLGIYYLNCQYDLQADSTLSEVINLHQTHLGKIDELYVRTLDDLAFIKGKLGQVEEAIKIYERILEILGSGKGGFYYQVLESYSTLLINQERFEQAAPFYQELKVPLADSEDYLQFLTDYYNVFVHLQDYVKAFEVSREILQSCQERSCGQEKKSNFQLNAARLAVLLGKYEDADQYYGQLLQEGSNSDYLQVQVLIELADVDGHLGRPFAQVSRLEKSLDAHVRNGMTDSTSYSRVVLRLGRVLTELGRFEKAETLFTNYISNLEKDHETDPEKLARAYQSLGNQKYLLRDFNGADLYLNRSRTLLHENDLTKSREYASVLNSLGALQEGIANYELAERYYKLGLVSVSEEESGLSLSIALASNLANVMNSYSPGNDSIEMLLSKAISWQSSLTGEQHPEFANLLNKRGLYLQDRGMPDQAEKDYLKALNILEYTVGKSHPEYLSILSNLGLLYDQQNRNEEALKYMQEAKVLYEQFYDDDNPGYVVAVNNLANMYTRLERFDEAAPLFEYLADIVLKEIRESFNYLSENEKKQFVTAKRKFQDNLKRYIVTRFTQDQSSLDPGMLSKWYELELNMKGILLNSTKRVRDQIFKSGDEALIALFSEWSLARSEVARRQSLKSTIKGDEQKSLDSLSSRITNLEKEIARASAGFASSFTSEDLNFLSISRSLSNDECSIEVIRTEINGENIYTALLALPGASSPELILIGKGEQLDQKAFALYKNTIKFKVDNGGPFDTYWRPIHDRIKNLPVRKIYYAPDGVYHKVSLATLFSPDNKKYLIEDYEVVQLTSTKDILQLKEGAAGLRNSKKVLLVGRPTYSLAGTATGGSIAGTREMISFDNIADLPGTEAEVTEINETLGSEDLKLTLLLGEESTEANFKTNLDHDIIHIATHGFFFDRQSGAGEYLDPMLYSGLLLAGASDEETIDNTGEDGVLTAYEIMNLEFPNLDMIVLSACETGTGEVTSGEGVYGLQRAFFVAGAKTLIMSLWKVDDAATKELMTNFYRSYLKSGDKREAFLNAQKQVKKKYKSPVYWGAFVMVGV